MALRIGVGAHQGDIADSKDIIDAAAFNLVEVIDHEAIAWAIA